MNNKSATKTQRPGMLGVEKKARSIYAKQSSRIRGGVATRKGDGEDNSSDLPS